MKRKREAESETEGQTKSPRQSPTSGEEQIKPSSKPNKPPTGEELRAIKDAPDLFKSNTFRLKIDALLPNVRPKSNRIPPLETFLLTLHSAIMAIPPVAPQNPLGASRPLIKKGVSVPYSQPLPTEETNWTVAFQPPSEITLVGSWANKLSVKGRDNVRFGVDLAVEMPAEIFQEKDYLNGRFFQKRAFYLATLAAALSAPKSGLNLDASYRSVSDDPRLTNLVLREGEDETKSGLKKLHAEICIIPVLPSNSPIPIHRLSPSQPNIRISSESDIHEPTPLYNTALLTATTTRSHLLSAHTLRQSTASFSDALALLRVWANQRGYSEGSRLCVHGFEGKGPFWSALLELLISGEQIMDMMLKSKRKPLGRGLSSYQLFRAALDFLGKHDFEKEHVFVKTQKEPKFSLQQYENFIGPVFVDSSSVSLLAGVPIGSLKLLGHDAKRTLTILDVAHSDPFTEVFLKDRRDLSTRFDAVIYIDLSSSKPRNSSSHAILDWGSAANALMSSLSSILTEGLGNRVKAVALLHPSASSRPLSQAHPTSPYIIHIGLIYNPQHAFRQVDHGPAATDTSTPSSLHFRNLWGDKAELRRFKDGSITESVVWEVKTADDKAHIPTRIVRHLLHWHFGIQDDAIQAWQEPFDTLVKLPESISKMYIETGSSMGFKGALTAFDALVKELKGLDDQLPLVLVTVSAASESLRYTSVFAPVPLPSSIASVLPPNAKYIHPIEFVLEFEKSAKWPDDLRAIQKMKLAFFEKIATLLMSSIDGLKASVVAGDGIDSSEIRDQARLEILTPEGWAFSARIHNEREAVLLDRIIENKVNRLPHVKLKHQDTKKDKEYHAAVEAKEAYLRQFIHSPRHHRAIVKLCHHFAAFAGTVRLVKRWFACHWLLHGHVSEEVIELLCAQFFVSDGWEQKIEDGQGVERFGVPSSKERGFAVVLEFLKEWKWEEGVFIPLYGADLLTEALPVSRATGVWAVSTLVDRDGYVWTSHGPDAVVARRISAFAKATWEYLEGMEHGRLNIPPMFTHPTTDYDFVIHLDTAVLPRYFQNAVVDGEKLSKRRKYSNLISIESETVIRPGFDPARSFFLDLQRIYLDTFKLFYDPFGGDCFAGVWDITLKEPKPFKVLGGYSSMPYLKDKPKDKSKDQVQLNRAAVLTEIERMGQGLVKGISVQN